MPATASKQVCRKTRYPHQYEAENAMWRIIRNGRKGAGKLPTRCYQCQTCGQWHLTSQPFRDGKPTSMPLGANR